MAIESDFSLVSRCCPCAAKLGQPALVEAEGGAHHGDIATWGYSFSRNSDPLLLVAPVCLIRPCVSQRESQAGLIEHVDLAVCTDAV